MILVAPRGSSNTIEGSSLEIQIGRLRIAVGTDEQPGFSEGDHQRI